MSDKFRVRDERRPGHFWADNEIYDIFASRIGVHAFAVYMALCKYVNKQAECNPSFEEIAKKLGISRRTVIRGVETLKKYHLVGVKNTVRVVGGKKRFGSNIYTVLDVKTRDDLVSISHQSSDSEALPSDSNASDLVSISHLNKTQEQDPMNKAPSAPALNIEQPMTSTPTPKRDPVIDAFERHLQAQQKPNETIVRSWNLPPHLEQLCLWFVEDMGLTVVKGDKGKWAKGASQLYEFHVSREQHREICRRARAQKARDGRPLTYGWPGALMEMARQVVSENRLAKGEMKLTTVAGVEVMAEEC